MSPGAPTPTPKDTPYVPLILIGFLMVLLGLADWSLWIGPSQQVIVKTNIPSTTSEVSESVVGPTASPAPKASPQVKTSLEKTTTVGRTVETTDTTSPVSPSETLRTTVVGVGALLILGGAFFGRITSIKGPGGIDIGLAPRAAAQVAGAVAEKTSDPEKAKVAYMATAARVSELGYVPAEDELVRIATAYAEAATSKGDDVR